MISTISTIGTVSSSVVAGQGSDLMRSSHLATVRPVYHHHYYSSTHSGSVSVPVVIGIVVLVLIVLVVRKVISSR